MNEQKQNEKFDIDSLDFKKLERIEFELLRVVDEPIRVDSERDILGYFLGFANTRLETVLTGRIDFSLYWTHEKFSSKEYVKGYLREFQSKVADWIIENCQERAFKVAVSIRPVYRSDK